MLQSAPLMYVFCFFLAASPEAVSGRWRERPGHARRRRGSEIRHEHQLPPGGVWYHGEQR